MKLVNIRLLLDFVLVVLSLLGGPIVVVAQSMTLEECIDAAMRNNKNLQVARSDLQLAEIKKEEIKSNRLPKIVTSGDYKFFSNLPYQLLPLSVFNGPEGQYREAQFGVPHNLGLHVQAAMPIYNPQIKVGIGGADIAAEMGRLQVEKSEEQVIFEVTSLYYNAQILQQQLSFVDSNLANTGRLLSTLRLLRSQGLAKGTDVGQVELQRVQLESQREQSESQLTQIYNGLNFFMGRELGVPLSVPKDIEQTESTDYPTSASVDVRLAAARNRLLLNELELIEKTKLPSVSLVADYGLTGFGYFGQPDPFFKIFPIGFIGVRADYPIWNKTTRFKVAQKEVEIMGNRLQQEHLQARNDLEIANAILQKKAAQADIPSFQKQIALAKSVYEQTLLQQRQGTAGITEVLLADHALREAQLSYLRALVEYLKADLDLKKAAGSIQN